MPFGMPPHRDPGPQQPREREHGDGIEDQEIRGREEEGHTPLTRQDDGRIDTHEHQQARPRSEEHTSELQSLMRISYAVFCLKKKKKNTKTQTRQEQNHNN